MAFLMIDIGAGTLDLLWYDSATGEHCKAVARSQLPSPGAPPGVTRGDNMMNGTVGLLEAVRRRKRLAPIEYL